MVEASMASEKVASALAPTATPVAPSCGAVLLTVGDPGVVSGAPRVTSIKSQVAGKGGAPPNEVEMIPTAIAFELSTQLSGIGTGSPSLVSGPGLPLVLTT